MSDKSNHIHRYKKVNLSRDKDKPYFVYKCVKPMCTHYVPVELAEGKLCECCRCQEPMIINKQVLVGNAGKPLTNPHCSDCVKRKKEKVENVAAIEEYLAGNKT